MDKRNWKPPIAAWGAALTGDLHSTAVASVPGGIEAQEVRGQSDFVANDTLPIKCHGCTREQLEQMDIVFGDPVDDLFASVQLPDGWRKERTDHSMWSHLVDDQGRKRASIFYKAAFYDRDAHLNLERRFGCKVMPDLGYSHPDYKKGDWHCIVTDCGEVIWQSEEYLEPEPEMSYDDDEKRQAWRDWYNRKDALVNVGAAWLNEHYPDWRNDLAYWDDATATATGGGDGDGRETEE